VNALGEPREAARQAVAANPLRPATAVLHDTADVRQVVFRIAPGQSVPPHRSVSTVLLTVLEGAGVLSGEDHGVSVERRCVTGDTIAYEPNELHGMRAEGETLLLLATITPRPGAR
jgi:quercetin dioxygenase-like cupin family protein